MKKQRNMFQTKEQDKTTEIEQNEMETHRRVKIMVTKMLTGVRRTCMNEGRILTKRKY